MIQQAQAVGPQVFTVRATAQRAMMLNKGGLRVAFSFAQGHLDQSAARRA